MGDAIFRAIDFGLFALMSAMSSPHETPEPPEDNQAIVQQVAAPEQQVVPASLVASSVVATEAQ